MASFNPKKARVEMNEESTAGDSTPQSPPSKASILIENFNSVQLKFVSDVVEGRVDGLNLLPIGCLERQEVERIFLALDRTGDGNLNAEDFRSGIPSVHAHLQQVWHELRNNFDFNDDGMIEPHEFLGYFVLHALYRTQCPQIMAVNSADQLATALLNFRTAFDLTLKGFQQALNQA
eukprot:gene31503-40911_t